MSPKFPRRLAAAGLALLSGCTVGPDYRRPEAETPAAYKEMDGWKPGQPQPAASLGPWWAVFGDPVLDGLERQVAVSNQTLKQSEAAYRAGVALLEQADAGLFPTLGFSASAQRARSGGGGRGGRADGGGEASIGNSFAQSLSASWTPDLWGRLRRTVESARATVQADAADLAAARLSLQATLARDYFTLRASDELKRLLEATAAAYADSLRIARNQYAAGIAAASDVDQAETQLQTTRAQAIAVTSQRAQLEHAIALLTGRPPAEVTLPPAAGLAEAPEIPPTLPSALLERRPDIAAAERRMAAANAQIGVAMAAWYPDLTLSGSFGSGGATLGKLLQASSNVWSFGPQLAQPLFDAGLIDARIAQARAAYDQEVAAYRQTVLTGFQQVEDQLAILGVLRRQAGVQNEAVAAAERAERQILNQYKAGTIAYTGVITAQAATLASRQTALTLRQNRLTAAVTLIESLGGGWDGAPPGQPPAPGE